MQLIVIFKGKSLDDKYLWENAADELPKQLSSVKNQTLSATFPKINQHYIIRFKRRDGNEMIDPYYIDNYYQTCNLCKVEKKSNGLYDFWFKKGKYKDLWFSELAASFSRNPDLEYEFVGYLGDIGKKTKNPVTRNNILRMFNSGGVKYCEIFGYGGSIVLRSKDDIKGMDMLTVQRADYLRVRHRLEWFQGQFFSPITFANCETWIKFLDAKFMV